MSVSRTVWPKYFQVLPCTRDQLDEIDPIKTNVGRVPRFLALVSESKTDGCGWM